MNTNILLVSVDDLKKNTPIDMNVEDNILEMSILDAQNIDIQDILGTTLYTSILTLVNSGTINDPENVEYKELLDNWVWPLQIKFSLYRSIMPMRVSFRNKGLMENNSDNSQPVDKEFVTYVENKIRNDIEFYSNKLKGYLCYFFEKYPDEKCNTPDYRGDYTEPNRKNSYFPGIYLS